MSERRSAARYSLWLPVIFNWDERGQRARGGFTRDVSAAGVFVVTNECPPTNTEVSMQVVLPSIDYTGTVRLACDGRVTRIEGIPGDCIGFAISGRFDEKWTRLVTA